MTDRFKLTVSPYHGLKTLNRSSTSENRSEVTVDEVVEITPVRVVEIVPTAVVEIVPVRVVEIVPVLVVEMVPVLVVEMIPDFATAETDIVRTKIPVQIIG